MPRVSHPWRKHFCDARFIVMEVDTSVMIILVMSWNTSTTAQVWLSWFCHKFGMDVHAWQKMRPTVTNTYHHGSVFFFVVKASHRLLRPFRGTFFVCMRAFSISWSLPGMLGITNHYKKNTLPWWYVFVTVGRFFVMHVHPWQIYDRIKIVIHVLS